MSAAHNIKTQSGVGQRMGRLLQRTSTHHQAYISIDIITVLKDNWNAPTVDLKDLGQSSAVFPCYFFINLLHTTRIY